MIGNIILFLVTLLGVVIFLLVPGNLWVVGLLLPLLSWVVYLLFVFPKKPATSRGLWVFVGCFVVIALLITAVTMLFLQLRSIPVELTGERFAAIAYVGARIFSGVIGLAASVVITFLFFSAVGYFSVVYVVNLHDEGLSFWDGFRSFVYLIFNIQLAWLLIENGEIIPLKKKGYTNEWLSRGKIIIKPGNAIVLEKAGKVTGIHGPGVVVTVKDQFIRLNQVIDLRPQFKADVLKNVTTADRIPLTIKLGVGYKITPAPDPDAPGVLKEKNFGLFPVHQDTLRKAAFNGTANGWTAFAFGAPAGQLRDQIMAHNFEDIFKIEGDTDDVTLRVNERRIKHIENTILQTVNSFADNIMGVTITSVDISEITLPKDVREAINMEVRSQAEANAIEFIEKKRNSARGEMVSSILHSIAGEINKPITDVELRLATTFAEISRRALTDDILGHEYVKALQKLADAEGTKIFNATPSESAIEPKHLPFKLNSGNGSSKNGDI